MSTYRAGQELLDKGGWLDGWMAWKSMVAVDGWLDGWMLFFFLKKGIIGVMKNEVGNFGPSKGKQKLLVNIDG